MVYPAAIWSAIWKFLVTVGESAGDVTSYQFPSDDEKPDTWKNLPRLHKVAMILFLVSFAIIAIGWFVYQVATGKI